MKCLKAKKIKCHSTYQVEVPPSLDTSTTRWISKFLFLFIVELIINDNKVKHMYFILSRKRKPFLRTELGQELFLRKFLSSNCFNLIRDPSANLRQNFSCAFPWRFLNIYLLTPSDISEKNWRAKVKLLFLTFPACF